MGLGSARATTNMAPARAEANNESAIGAVDHEIGCTLYPNLLPGRIPRAPVRVSRFHENVLASGRKKDWVKWGRW